MSGIGGQDGESPRCPITSLDVYRSVTGLACLGLIGVLAVVNRIAYSFGRAERKWPM